MKSTSLVIFLSVVLSVYSLVNYYIFIRGWQSLSGFALLRQIFTAVFIALFLSYIVGRILEYAYPGLFAEMLIRVGSFWLAAMLYFFLFVLIADIFRLIFHFIPAVHSWMAVHSSVLKPAVLCLAAITVASLLVAGYINAGSIRVKTIRISIQKSSPDLKELNLVMLSDIHLGTLIGKKKLTHIVKEVNGLNPDLVLLAGDIVDENIAPVIRMNLGEQLLQFRSRLGVYGIPGNHEYIGGAEPAISYLEQHGIKMLRDTALLIDGRFWLAGRDDRDKSRFTGKTRKSVDDLLTGIDTSLPVILMDHQPFDFGKSCRAGVDLQLSGHTHHGQLWPLNYITAAIYEQDWGYLKKENTHFYVSCGAGTWGPPLRLGSRPEIVRIILSFK